MPQLERRTDSPVETPEVPLIHVSTGEESSGSGSDSTQGFRPRHQQERNPERNSSPVLTWILGYFWSLPRGVSPRLVWGHAGGLSSRAVPAVSPFPSRGSRDLWLSLEVFPRGFPRRLSLEAFQRGFHTGLTHVSPLCKSIPGLKVEAVQGKQVSLEWTETSGGLWEWWHDPGVPLAFPVESAFS